MSKPSNIIRLTELKEGEGKWPSAFIFNNRVFMVCVDESDCSKLALLHALNLLDPAKDRLVLLHVSPEGKEDHGNAYLSRVGGLVRDWDDKIKYHKVVVHATDPRQAICEEAAKHDVDYLFMGNRGAGGLSAMLMGSVSSYVAKHAPCPVTIVREKASE